MADSSILTGPYILRQGETVTTWPTVCQLKQECLLSLDVKIPWIMCEQGDIATVINTCNGFYCHDRIRTFRWAYPKQPQFFTELWSGWYHLWGEPTPTRPVEDLAVAILEWIANGGSLVTYYMWHGGTNFGRDAGGPLITTSYDYDAPINE